MQFELNSLVIVWDSSSDHTGLSYRIFSSAIAESNAVVILIVGSADVEFADFYKLMPNDLIFSLWFLKEYLEVSYIMLVFFSKLIFRKQWLFNCTRVEVIEDCVL